MRDAWGEFAGGARIFGVSVDSAASHEKFIGKYQLPFPLLADPEKKIVADYGVWVEKSMYGRKYMGTERTTFVIDGRGRDQRDIAQGKTSGACWAIARRVGRREMSCQAARCLYLRCSRPDSVALCGFRC